MVFGALILGLVACTGGPPTPDGGVARVALGAEPAGGFSVLARMDTDFFLTDLTSRAAFDTQLVDADVKIFPDLVASREWNQDDTELRTVLDSAAVWGDGTPVTSADLALTVAVARDPEVDSTRRGYVAALTPESPIIVDARTMIWRFTEPQKRQWAEFHLSALAAMPAHELEGVPFEQLSQHPLHLMPMAVGPWMVREWQRGKRISLAPNPSWRGPIRRWSPLEGLELSIIPSEAERVAALADGRVDVLFNGQWDTAQAAVREHPDLRLDAAPSFTFEYIVWNHVHPERAPVLYDRVDLDGTVDPRAAGPHPVLGDLAVRRALAQSIDLEALKRELFPDVAGTGTVAKPAIGSVSPEMAEHADGVQPLAHDPDAARAELEAAGWIDPDGDGIRARDGQPLVLELLINLGNARRARIASAFQLAAREIGVKVAITQLPGSALFARIQRHDYDAALLGFRTDTDIDMSPMWHSSPTQALNYTAFSSAEVDKLIESALRSRDAQARLPLWQQAQAKVYEAQPALFLYWVGNPVLRHKRLTGLDPAQPLQESVRKWRIVPD